MVESVRGEDLKTPPDHCGEIQLGSSQASEVTVEELGWKGISLCPFHCGLLVVVRSSRLGRLYEEGAGVAKNPAEAYKWYLIAARAGDSGSRLGAVRVRPILTAPARIAAENAAAAFKAGAPAPVTATAAAAPASAAPSADLVIAQKALSQLGYYHGPTDGVASPALHGAIAAYQHEQGLPATGSPDPATIGKLSAYTR